MFSGMSESLHGMVFTTPRSDESEDAHQGLSRLVRGAVRGFESASMLTQCQWVVDAYVWLPALTRPGLTRAHLARRNRVWPMLEGWGIVLPEGERFEAVLVGRRLPAKGLGEYAIGLDDARRDAGGVRGAGTRDHGIVFFGGESEDHRSFELYALSSDRAVVSALLEG